jgi:transposase-like protein
MGSWEFDEARKEAYEASVRAAQSDGTMTEIAARMGVARILNSWFTFDLDPQGRPRLTRTDRATGQSEQTRITVAREGAELRVTEESSGAVFRLQPFGTDPRRLTMIDETRRQVVPLKRR